MRWRLTGLMCRVTRIRSISTLTVSSHSSTSLKVTSSPLHLRPRLTPPSFLPSFSAVEDYALLVPDHDAIIQNEHVPRFVSGTLAELQNPPRRFEICHSAIFVLLHDTTAFSVGSLDPILPRPQQISQDARLSLPSVFSS